MTETESVKEDKVSVRKWHPYRNALIFIGVGMAAIIAAETVDKLRSVKVDWVGFVAAAWGLLELLGGKIEKFIEKFSNGKTKEDLEVHQQMLEDANEIQTTQLMVALGENLANVRNDVRSLRNDTAVKHKENKEEFIKLFSEIKRQDTLHVEHDRRFLSIENDVKVIRASNEQTREDVCRINGKIELVIKELNPILITLKEQNSKE